MEFVKLEGNRSGYTPEQCQIPLQSAHLSRC